MKSKLPRGNQIFSPSPPEITPAQLHYAMPAEWEPHTATWMAWPHYQKDWPGKFAPIAWIFADIVRLLAQSERVHLFVQPSKGDRTANAVRDILARTAVNLAHITLHALPTDRSWMRDSGPIFITPEQKTKSPNPALALVDFKFNAWAKFDNSVRDDALPAAIADILHIPSFTAFGSNNRHELQRFVLEGGSIDVNGRGTLLTTEECLLSRIQQRNPGFSRDRIEQTLREYLGVTQILWLAAGIAGDIDTHGHVDDTARFVNPTTIVTCVEPNRRDANHTPLRHNLQRLAKMRDLRGRPFNIVELPMPAPVYFNNQRLPASYANFYIANCGVLVPVFNDPQDVAALKILEQCFPDRPLIPVYCRDLVCGLGTLHCITQQQPSC